MGEKSKCVTFAGGEWHEGDPKLISIGAHSIWLGSAVFDGARVIDGCAPDLDMHCARLVESAETMGLGRPAAADEIKALVLDGVKRLNSTADLYLRPLIYAEDGFMIPEPESSELAVMVYERPLPGPAGFAACRVNAVRPGVNMAPTAAKAACLYPNVARALREAAAKGFDTGVGMDPNGNVAEFSMANLFFARDGAVVTPMPNGTFLNGITRRRIIQLLRDDGHDVIERTVTWADLETAAEIFGTGNYAKITPCSRLEDRQMQPGPIYARARELYFQYARDTSRII
ncbi:MAG: branched-chain amino acid aminotransferase [Rhodospirillales bacterium]